MQNPDYEAAPPLFEFREWLGLVLHYEPIEVRRPSNRLVLEVQLVQAGWIIYDSDGMNQFIRQMKFI